MSVSAQARLVTDLTDSLGKLRHSVENLFWDEEQGDILGRPCSGLNPSFWSAHDSPCGFKVLWNAVFFSATLKLRPQPGRKAILLLTDGLDTGSDHGLRDAVAAYQNAEAIVYSIRSYAPGWTSTLSRQSSTRAGRTVASPISIGLRATPAAWHLKQNETNCPRSLIVLRRTYEVSMSLVMPLRHTTTAEVITS